MQRKTAQAGRAVRSGRSAQGTVALKRGNSEQLRDWGLLEETSPDDAGSSELLVVTTSHGGCTGVHPTPGCAASPVFPKFAEDPHSSGGVSRRGRHSRG